jgi:hypothetical protein
LPPKGCGVVFSNGFRLAGPLLATIAPPWKSRDSAGRRSIPIAHKKTFNINIVAMVVKTARRRLATRRSHGNVKILFSVFFRETAHAG